MGCYNYGKKWIYSNKYNVNGTLDRCKARLVVLRNNQIEGEDFTDTFTSMAKLSTIHMILKIAATKNYLVHQMDVNNAFLHGDLDEY